ncbi:MAG TPA: hypothetical protein VMG08_15065 [Allosphingosinicella sp.]|nr:hypothetical protein [Allosphingosinicella sp.]
MPLNLIFISPGNYSLEDNGIPGDGISVIKDGNGVVIFTFAHPADSLGFTVTTPGVNISVNLTDSLGAANLTIGNLTNAAETPDSISVNRIHSTGTVTLVSNGPITEVGADAGADIVAGQLVLSAQSGIGTGANVIETQTSALEAETVTGGISLGNFGSVQIGGISDQVDGLDVATSGDLSFVNYGSILLGDETGAETVHGGSSSGNVTLIANGFDADIIATSNQDAINVPGGSLFLQAGRDIGFGIIGTDFDNDVRARGSVTVNAGRDFLIDGFSDLASDDFGAGTGGNAVINAGRNIHVRNIAGTDGSIAAGGAAGADVILTTGAGGALVLDAPTSGAVSSFSGDVTVSADRILIAATSGITSAGLVTLRPATAGREMVLGSGSDAVFAVELSDGELDRIFAANLLIGGSGVGNIQVTSALTVASVNTLTLRSGEDISIAAGISVATSLALVAGNNIFQQSGTITTGTLSAQVDALAGDNGVGGVGLLGSVSLTGTPGPTSLTLNGNAEADTLRGAEGVNQTVNGNGGDDTLVSSGEGRYFGGEGNDLVLAGLSSGVVPEMLDGGNGIDTVDASSFGGAYVINLATGATNFGYETFANFENAITGTGADQITGTAGFNILTGGDGNDLLDGAGGADMMNGGLGDDRFFVDTAGDGVSELSSEGNDRIFASVSYALALGVSVETLSTSDNAGTGAINLIGNELANTIIGNAGVNTLTGGQGNDVLDGKEGNDVLNGGLNNDVLYGRIGNDTLYGGSGVNHLDGGQGDDQYVIENGTDTVVELVGEGNDRIFAGVGYTLTAGASVETMSTDFNAGTNAINLTGNELANTIIGNAGVNALTGGGGDDLLDGKEGNDTLSGGANNDILLGGDGNDMLYGGTGTNQFSGGLGDDQFVIDNGSDTVAELLGQGSDRVFASVSYTLAAGVSVEILSTDFNAGTNAINLTGNDQGNSVIGNAGANVLNGGGAGDVLDAREGNDTLDGGTGNDSLFGRAGNDIFAFTTALGAGNVDTIGDFVGVDDQIQLENAVFTGLAAGALAAGAFNTGAAATEADDRIIYNLATGALLFDVDGVGGSAAVQFATLTGIPVLAAADFQVI